jgi:hypothetical protein
MDLNKILIDEYSNIHCVKSALQNSSYPRRLNVLWKKDHYNLEKYFI